MKPPLPPCSGLLPIIYGVEGSLGDWSVFVQEDEQHPSQVSLNGAFCGALMPQHYASFVFRGERTSTEIFAFF